MINVNLDTFNVMLNLKFTSQFGRVLTGLSHRLMIELEIKDRPCENKLNFIN